MRWNELELELVRIWYPRGAGRELAWLLGRSAEAVKTIAARMGAITRRLWSEQEKAFVRGNYRRLPTREIAMQLNRTIGQIHQAADRLGLSIPQPIKRQGFEKFLRAMHAEGWTDAEIARVWKCERHAVGVRRAKLGLPHNRLSEHMRQRVREKTREQLAAAGLKSLAELRTKAFRDRARAAGWPEDLRPRSVQILNLLWDNGPMTRREIAAASGMPWKGSRKSLVSNDPEGSYLAHLQARGLVVRMGRHVKGKGKGRSVNLYSLPLWIQRGAHEQSQRDSGQ